MNLTSDLKRINDPIHGLMEFEDWIIKFIDTEHFQRLRNIKQLGTAYYVYPGASHNRFEHSLGVAHLAYTLLKRIKETQPEIKHNEKDLKCVTLAALFHDLGILTRPSIACLLLLLKFHVNSIGHGPFSHLFERGFALRTKFKKWNHEKCSVMMFENLLEVNNDIANDFNSDDIEFIKALIIGDRKNCKNRPLYLFDIVANKTNSIDVDYLARDCYYLGMKTVFDPSRLMNFARVVDDQLTYYFKECYGIYELFHTRYSLHKKAYNHRVCRAIDYMICDALVEADQVFKISESVENANKFLRMDDTILNQIEVSDKSGLEKSKEIIKRIRTRKLYKFVDEVSVPSDKKTLAEEKITAKEIVKNQEGLEEYDVIVEQLKLNYAMEDKNPVDHVKFYDKNSKIFNLERSKVSYLVPEQYEEINFRVFTRNPTSEKIQLIKGNFRKLLEDYNFETTPVRESHFDEEIEY